MQQFKSMSMIAYLSAGANDEERMFSNFYADNNLPFRP